MSLTSRSVAIIGSGGTIGRLLISSLQSNENINKVITIDPVRPTGLPSRVKCFEIDLLSDGALDEIAEAIDTCDIGTLIYLGYLSDSPFSQENQSQEVAQVISALSRRPVPKVIFASSTSVYGALPTDPTHLSENTPRVDDPHSDWIRDKVAAERLIDDFILDVDSSVAVFRFAPVLGPTVRNFLTEYLYRKAVPTVKGADPQVQVIHERDVCRALVDAVEKEYDGPYNIVADGALPLSVTLRIGRRRQAPVSDLGSYPLTQLLWDDEISETPKILLDLFKYVWVADGRKALDKMSFHPERSTRETVEEFYRSRAAQAAAAAAAASGN